MTPEEMRVLEAIASSEKTTPAYCLPLKHIATMALGGDADLAEAVLSDLNESGLVIGNTWDLDSGWLTTRGRSSVRDR